MNNSEIKNRLLTEEHHDFKSLCLLVSLLRSEDGCPWDRVQTHTSIRKDFIEETYEVIEAIDNDDPVLMCEELGDVMLQTVFHADIEREAGRFTVEDVLDGITDKLIHRHPHVFGDVKADTSEKVLDNWDKIKKKEKGRDSTTASMKSIPPALPALMRAQKIGKYAAKAGFDFPDAESAFGKIPEETAEVAELIGGDDRDRLEEELGDLLFAVVNVCRKTGIDAEYALDRRMRSFFAAFRTLRTTCAPPERRYPILKWKHLIRFGTGIRRRKGENHKTNKDLLPKLLQNTDIGDIISAV